jgi:nucleoside-diphosphate-sugar epimerase
MRIVVTGATGFIGAYLCPVLFREGFDVARLDLRRQEPGALAGAQAVIHLAAIAHRRARAEDLERVNLLLAKRIGEAAAATGASLLYLSSVKVHGEVSKAPFTETSPFAPEDPYAASKARAEEALRGISGLRLAVLRPPLVYGPGVKANFLALMKAIDTGLPLPFASVDNRRSVLYVGNLVHAITHCIGKEGTFLLADGPAVSTPELCRSLAQALRRRARLFPFPMALLPRKLAGSLEVDNSWTRRALGWQPPFSFDAGLQATADWYRAR